MSSTAASGCGLNRNLGIRSAPHGRESRSGQGARLDWSADAHGALFEWRRAAIAYGGSRREHSRRQMFFYFMRAGWRRRLGISR